MTPRSAMLERPVAPVDTVNMHEMTALLTDQQELLAVLAAYREAEQADVPDSSPAELVSAESASAESEEASGDAEEPEAGSGKESRWIPRLRELPGIAAEQLSPLHGQLIAHGLLRFNLLGRTAGVGYRVTPEGRQALASAQQVAVGA